MGEQGRGRKPNFKKDGPRPKRRRVSPQKSKVHPEKSELIRLNKYLANSGVASRREADKLIEAGLVTVNGKVVTTLGTKVRPTDDVRFEGERLRREKKVYILLNKPKDFITTVDDPRGRKTVMDLIQGACDERVYPVGRLDRMTTGLLLLTNDGEMAKKLLHPSHGVRKLYHVVLDRKLTAEDKAKIEAGLTLEDGKVDVDEVSFIKDAPHNEVGLKIHLGKNRIVRRIFDHLGYKVVRLDRVAFGSLTKRNLRRGHWRMLNRQEIANLRMIG